MTQSDPLAAIRALLNGAVSSRVIREDLSSGRHVYGHNPSWVTSANLEEALVALQLHLDAQAQQIAALTTMLGAPEGSDPVATMRRAIYDAEQAARAAGRPEGEYLRDSIAALTAQLETSERNLDMASRALMKRGVLALDSGDSARCQALEQPIRRRQTAAVLEASRG